MANPRQKQLEWLQLYKAHRSRTDGDIRYYFDKEKQLESPKVFLLQMKQVAGVKLPNAEQPAADGPKNY